MNFDDILTADNIKKIADKVGVDPGDVLSAARKVLPKLSGGIKGFLGMDDGPKVKANPWDIFAQAATGKSIDDILDGDDDEAGNKVLEAAFGDKDGSRAVAAEAAKETGVDEGAIKKMLPNLASIVASKAKDLDAGAAKKLLENLF